MLSSPVHLETGTVDRHNIRVLVKNPILHITWDEGQYTSYAIYIETNHLAFEYPKTLVRRRYSEFARLKKMLKTQHPTIVPPNLPSRSLFANKYCPIFINQRKKGLEEFLDKILQNHLYLSNRSLHLFIQSNLSMDEIERLVNGQGRTHTRSEPHLILCPCPVLENHGSSLSQDGDDSESLCDSNQLDSSAAELASQTMESHATLGSRIITCSPSLEVPSSSEVTLPDIDENEVIAVGSADSDYCSTVGNSSPTWDKCQQATHGILHFRSSSQNSSISGSPVRKKKVSFHSEVTVAHLLTD